MSLLGFVSSSVFAAVKCSRRPCVLRKKQVWQSEIEHGESETEMAMGDDLNQGLAVVKTIINHHYFNGTAIVFATFPWRHQVCDG